MEHTLACSNRRIAAALAFIVASWFAAIALVAVTGLFNRPGIPPLPIGIAATVPILAFAIAYATSHRVREFLLGLDRRVLTLLHTWRVVGIVFVLLYLRGQLPASFALPAGIGDILIGISAPVVARFARSNSRRDRARLLVWHWLGIIDLVMAVSLGILNSSGPLGILPHSVDTHVMGALPLTLIPTFLVPLAVILHVIVLAQLKRAEGEDA
jgi:hypothetical protein